MGSGSEKLSHPHTKPYNPNMTGVLFDSISSSQYVLSSLEDKTSLRALLHQGILKKTIQYVNINYKNKILDIINLLLTYNPLGNLLGLNNVISPPGLVLANFQVSCRIRGDRGEITSFEYDASFNLLIFSFVILFSNKSYHPRDRRWGVTFLC